MHLHHAPAILMALMLLLVGPPLVMTAETVPPVPPVLPIPPSDASPAPDAIHQQQRQLLDQLYGPRQVFPAITAPLRALDAGDPAGGVWLCGLLDMALADSRSGRSQYLPQRLDCGLDFATGFMSRLFSTDGKRTSADHAVFLEEQVLYAVARIQRSAAVPVLCWYLSHDIAGPLQRQAITALAAIPGSAGSGAILAILHQGCRNRAVLLACVHACRRSGLKAAADDLRALRGHASAMVRRAAGLALSALGCDPGPESTVAQSRAVQALVTSCASMLEGRSDAQARELLAPLVETVLDPRNLLPAARERIAADVEEQMLAAWCSGDLTTALRLAQEVGAPAFAGFSRQRQAQELAEQSPAAIHAGLHRPTVEDWKRISGRLDRHATIAYLLERVPLMNCQADSRLACGDWYSDCPDGLINPYAELKQLQLQPSDLPQLAAALDNRSFMRATRPEEGSHVLCRARWPIADLIENAAKRPLIPDDCEALDGAGIAKVIAGVVAFAASHRGIAPRDLRAAAIRELEDMPTVETEMAIGLGEHAAGVADAIATRICGFRAAHQESIVRLMYHADPAAVLARSQDWMTTLAPAARIWVAVTVLVHGSPGDPLRQKARDLLVGLMRDGTSDVLAEQLAEWFPAVFPHADPALRDAVRSVLERQDFRPTKSGGRVLECFLCEGDPAIVALVSARLRDTRKAGTVLFDPTGHRDLEVCEYWAGSFAACGGPTYAIEGATPENSVPLQAVRTWFQGIVTAAAAHGHAPSSEQ